MRLAGEPGERLTLSSPRFPSRDLSSPDNDLEVIFDIMAVRRPTSVVFAADDWLLTDNMCLTVNKMAKCLVIENRAVSNVTRSGIFQR